MPDTPHPIDLRRLKVYPLSERKSMSRIDEILVNPDATPKPCAAPIQQQVARVKIHKSIEHGKLTPVFGTSCPPKGLSGLIREVDVFSQGYRPGTLGQRGLSPEELAHLRPGIVYVSLCAFSHVGPWASRRGFDTVVQNVSGITSRQGELFPGAQRALFRKYHIGGCSSCGFSPNETLAGVCARNENVDGRGPIALFSPCRTVDLSLGAKIACSDRSRASRP